MSRVATGEPTCEEVVCGHAECQTTQGHPVCVCPDGSRTSDGTCPTQFTRHDIGINIDAPLDYNTNHIFADVMKTAREFTYPGTEEPLKPSELDEQGWPLRDADCLVWHNSDMNGTYRLTFKGRAKVEMLYESAEDARWLHQLYNPETGYTTAAFRVKQTDHATFGLRFTGVSGGIRDIRLMRPISPGNDRSYDEGVVFTEAFRAAVAPFSTIRFMDFTATNWNQQRVWSDRVKPDAASFNRTAKGYGWQGRGAAWEYVVMMANELRKDAWICVPFWVDEDYVRRLAQLFRDGNSVVRGLDAERKLYVEFSNEVWNYWENENHDLAVGEVERGDPLRLNYDRRTREDADDGWLWAFRRVGGRTLQISNVFREVFGDDAMMTRIRPILSWQAVRTATASTPLEYIEAVYPKPVSHYLYGGGGSAYYSPDLDTPGLTLDRLWDSGCMALDNFKKSYPENTEKCWQLYNSYLCSAYGIRRIAYEGGPSFDPEMPGDNDAVMAAAWTDPRIAAEVIEHQRAWDEWGGDLLVYFTLSRPDYPWAFARSVYDLDHPKYQALIELLSHPKTPLTVGARVGATLDGNAAQLDSDDWDWKDAPGKGPRRVEEGQWVAYAFKVDQSGEYRVQASVGSDEPLDRVRVWADGIELGSAQTQVASGSVTTSAFRLLPGLRSVRLAGVGGSVLVKTVTLRRE